MPEKLKHVPLVLILTITSLLAISESIAQIVQDGQRSSPAYPKQPSHKSFGADRPDIVPNALPQRNTVHHPNVGHQPGALGNALPQRNTVHQPNGGPGHRTNGLPNRTQKPANPLTADAARHRGDQAHNALKPSGPGGRQANTLPQKRPNGNVANAGTTPGSRKPPANGNRLPKGDRTMVNRPNPGPTGPNSHLGNRNRMTGPGQATRRPNNMLTGTNAGPSRIQRPNSTLGGLNHRPIGPNTRPGLANRTPTTGPKTNAVVSHINHPPTGTGSVLARPSQFNPRVARLSEISHTLVHNFGPVAAGAIGGGTPLLINGGLGGSGLLTLGILGGLGEPGRLGGITAADLLTNGDVINDPLLDGAILGANLLTRGIGGDNLVTDLELAAALQAGDISVGDLLVMNTVARTTQQNIADTARLGGSGGFGSSYVWTIASYTPPAVYPSTPMVMMPADAQPGENELAVIYMSDDAQPLDGGMPAEGIADATATQVATTDPGIAVEPPVQPEPAADVPAGTVPATATAAAPAGAASAGLKLVLTNARDSGGPINYSLSGTPFAMEPGYTQTLTERDSWLVEFDRGGDFGMGRYTLTEGTYTFTVTDKGWELYNTTFNVTVDNSANSGDFFFAHDGREEVVKAGATLQLTSKFPIVVSFDRGDGGQPAERSLADGTYRVGLTEDAKAIELFAAKPDRR